VAPFVPEDFAVPGGLETDAFRLEPLGPRHNEADHRAWSSSIAHIRDTPGFRDRDWPPPRGMTLAGNLADLERHAEDFAARRGFTYSVVAPGGGDVLGCVYIYPPHHHPAAEGTDADVRSWVRADVADLDAPLHAAVAAWLAADWPFARVAYAARPTSRRRA
jgi:hypothetical protein